MQLPTAGSVAVVALLGAGSGASASSAVSSSPPGCSEIVAALETEVALVNASIDDDNEQFIEVAATLPDVLDAAIAAAPDEIAEDIETWADTLRRVVEATDGVDIGDNDAVDAALAEEFADSSEEDEIAWSDAQDAVTIWAVDVCGFDDEAFGGDASASVVPPCHLLDAAVAAEAAGLDIEITFDVTGGSTALIALVHDSCLYGDGALMLSTLALPGSVDEAVATWISFVEENLPDGQVLDVDLGDLPESSLVTEAVGGVTVAVLEAEMPFSVTVTGEAVDPADVVAAAEALLSLEGPAASSSEPATTEG